MGSGEGWEGRFRRILEAVDRVLGGRGVDPLLRSVLAYLMARVGERTGDRRYHRLLAYVARLCGLHSHSVELSPEEMEELRRIVSEVREYFARGPRDTTQPRRYTVKLTINVRGPSQPGTVECHTGVAESELEEGLHRGRPMPIHMYLL